MRGPAWTPDEEAILLKAVADKVSSPAAAALLPNRTTKACEGHAREMGHPFRSRIRKKPKPVGRRPSETWINPHQPIEAWAITSARAKAKRADVLAEAHRLGVSTALPWRVVVKTVAERLAA